MRYWPKRLKLLWKFVKLIPEAKELEREIQRIEQKKHDVFLSNQLLYDKKEKELAYHIGYVHGVEFCLKRFQ